MSPVDVVNSHSDDLRPRTLRGDIELVKAELGLDPLKPLVDDLHGEHDIAEHPLVDLDDVLGGVIVVVPCGGDVDLGVKPLSELHSVSPSFSPKVAESNSPG